MLDAVSQWKMQGELKENGRKRELKSIRGGYSTMYPPLKINELLNKLIGITINNSSNI